MSIRANAELNAEVALLKNEINQRKGQHLAILTAQIDDPDVFKVYKHIMQDPLRRDSVVNIHRQVRSYIVNLEKDLHRTKLRLNPWPGSHRPWMEDESKLSALVEFHSSVSPSLDGFIDAERQLASNIQGLFEKLADALRSFSMPLVGIVARYAL